MTPVHVSKEEAPEYHGRPPHGKVEVRPTEPAPSRRDLALAYTPGVACGNHPRGRPLFFWAGQ